LGLCNYLIMRKTVFIVCIILNPCLLFAQTPALKTPDPTVAVAQPAKPSKSSLKIIAGTNMLAANDIVTNLSRSKELSTFYRIVEAAGLNETFNSKGPITVFVPNDQAFANLPPGKLDTLLKTEHKYDLIALITYHVLPGKITAKEIGRQINSNKGQATFITLTGSKLTAKLNADRNIILIDENGGQSVISRFDISQNNGLIDIIASVLVPKFKNL